MKTMSPAFHFVECNNPSCRLRFPLDLDVFEGKFCPRCGSQLRAVSPGLPSLSTNPIPDKPMAQLIGLLDNIRSSHNVGSIFRSADGVGLSHLHLCGITPTPERNPEVAKTALGAEKAVAWSYHPNAIDLVLRLKSEGMMLVVLERTEQSTPIQDFCLNPEKTYVLVVGSEPAGVDPDLLKLADQVISLPMLGTKESLNAAISFSIAAYWLRLIK